MILLYYSLVPCRTCPPTIRKIDHLASSIRGLNGGAQHAKFQTKNVIVILGGTKNDQCEESENKWAEIKSSSMRNSSRCPVVSSTIQMGMTKVIL